MEQPLGVEKVSRTHTSRTREGVSGPLIMFIAYHSKENHLLDRTLVAFWNNKVKDRIFVRVWFLFIVPENSSVWVPYGDWAKLVINNLRSGDLVRGKF